MLTAAMRLAVHRDASAATLGAGGDAAVETLLWSQVRPHTRRYAGTSSETLASASRLWKNENLMNLTASGGIALIAPASAGDGVDVAVTHLALGSVVADEPVVAESLRILLTRQSHDFRRLTLEPFELALADFQNAVTSYMSSIPLPCRAAVRHRFCEAHLARLAQRRAARIRTSCRSPASNY
jgi:hypothetical protein